MDKSRLRARLCVLAESRNWTAETAEVAHVMGILSKLAYDVDTLTREELLKRVWVVFQMAQHMAQR